MGGGWELEPGDILILSDNDGVFWGAAREDALGWLVGEVLGDGVYNTGREQYAHVRFWGQHAKTMARRAYAIVDRIPLTYTQGPVPTGPVHVRSAGHWQITSRKLSNLCQGMLEPATKLILPALEARSSSFIAGFLRGWYDADGCVLGSIDKGRNVTLCSSVLPNLKIAQRMLARLGIGSRLHPYRTEKGAATFPDGKGGLVECQQQATHELMVTRSSLMRFAKRVGFGPGQGEEAGRLRRPRGLQAAVHRHPGERGHARGRGGRSGAAALQGRRRWPHGGERVCRPELTRPARGSAAI